MRCVLWDGVEDRGLLSRLGVRYGMKNNFGSTDRKLSCHPPSKIQMLNSTTCESGKRFTADYVQDLESLRSLCRLSSASLHRTLPNNESPSNTSPSPPP